MSYGTAGALQAAIWERLAGDAALSALIGGAVHDALPAGALPETYVALGPEEVRDRSDQTHRGAEHDVTLSVVTARAGLGRAKEVAARVSDALLATPLTLARGQVVGLWFLRARARRIDNGAGRRVDLTFRALVEDTET
ncbi:DUF3168 domain-containing protein [Haematobacter massiliensis]|uniref:Gene transfer agent protein n=1 Tax=Haematobacter massiliensis TaxID=195105 RepID=A0A086YBL9_9RHOB|nr:DUF3168 domain-containing protein [Haematobacter massiliensis]KFI31669.1 gene transfer agent protein [Haematobacter massiliensis]OWJ72059.1 DUF3168 domain-containing protein [Haematobacter massiliensis]OWJ81562.1 DUF3168 domain-containing protein [Haematobacter massiliensis]QBJ24064.1 DUF3168 domain-containing protein [Haematobacter massiliensis]